MPFTYPIYNLCTTLFTLVGIILLKVSDCKQITYYDEYCQEEHLYKPYLRYYMGRKKAMDTGVPFKELGPGFYSDFMDWENTYVCLNGLAWLYYKLTTSHSVVYETPELHSFKHQCMLVNGLKGPGIHSMERNLLGILLVGDAMDYRKPSLSQFTAPYQEECLSTTTPPCTVAKPIINVTSVMMIGDDTECILGKGRQKRHLRIRSAPVTRTPPTPPLVDDYAGSFCRLSYQHLEEALQDPATEKPIALEYLKNDETIKTTGCWTPGNYTKMTKDILDKRKAEVDAWDTSVPEYDSDGWMAAQVPPVEGGYVPSSDPCATAADCEAAKLKTDIEAAQTALAADPTSDSLKEALGVVKLRLCISEVFLGHEKLKKAADEIEAPWTAAAEKAAEVITALENVEDKKKEVEKAEKDLKDNTDATQVQTLTQAIKTAEDEFDKAVGEYKKESALLAPLVSKAESMRKTGEALITAVKKMMVDYTKKVKVAVGGGTPSCKKPTKPMMDTSGIITIKRTELKIEDEKKDPTKFSKDATMTCGELPKPVETCNEARPLKKRACQLLNARKNNFVTAGPPPTEVNWDSEDEWRKDVLEIIEDIFTAACSPMLKLDFVVGLSRIMKGYLTDFVSETLNPPQPAPAPGPDPAGRRRRREAKNILGEASGEGIVSPPPPPGRTRRQDPSDTTITTTTTKKPSSVSVSVGASNVEPLPARRPFWDQIMVALKDCREQNTRLYFKKEIKDGRDNFLFIKMHPNGTNSPIDVEHFMEQADDEFAFNWVIDQHWRVFATVLGICMPAYEKKIPLITSKFFTHYTEDFFYPLATEWAKNRDNGVLRYLMGEYYGSSGDTWTRLCMESSFIHSGDVRYRPPRKLYVNGGSEANFFTSGPLAGTSGIYV